MNKNKSKIINIIDIKSFYNLKTNNNFEIKTTILSHLSNEYDIETGDELTITPYQIEPEQSLNGETSDVTIKTLEKRRIKISTLIRNNIDAQNENILNYSIDGAEDDIDHDEYKLRNFCNETCNECTANVTFRIKDILQERIINQKKISQELKMHGHPMSRIIKKVQRNAYQAKQELIAHYVLIHKVKS